MPVPVFRPLLLVLLLLIGTAGLAHSDDEGAAVATLLAPAANGSRAEPDDAALKVLLDTPRKDPWILVEYLLANERQDVAMRLAALTDAEAIGPLQRYAGSPEAKSGVAQRLQLVETVDRLVVEGDFETALLDLGRAARLPGRRSVAAIQLEKRRGDILVRIEQPVDGITAWLSAGRDAVAIGWWEMADPLFSTAAERAMAARNLDLAARAVEGVRAVEAARGRPFGVAASTQNLGMLAHARGDLPGAMRCLEEACAQFEALGREHDVAQVRSLRSEVRADMGDLQGALADQAFLARHFEGRPQDEAMADNLLHLGSVRVRLADEEGALAAYAKALEIYRALGDEQGQTIAIGDLGVAHALGERWDEAIAQYRKALALALKREDWLAVAGAQNNLAAELRHSAEALREEASRTEDPDGRKTLLARARKALSEAEDQARHAVKGAADLGSAGLACGARHTLGLVLMSSARIEKALPILEQARDDAARMQAWHLELVTLEALARARMKQGDARGALREARQAAEKLLQSFTGLPDSDVARARRLVPDVFDIGIRAAGELERGQDIAYFMEAGRAFGLIRALGGRAAALRAAVPEALSARLAQATQAKAEAFRAWQLARAARDLNGTREGWKAYEARRDAERAVLEEVERAEAAIASRIAPARPISLEDLEKRMEGMARPGLRQVFLICNMQAERTWVLRLDDQREGATALWLDRDTTVALREAMAKTAAARDGELDAEALTTISKEFFGRLDLKLGPTRLYISPDREMAYIPFAAVVPDDWEIVYEPSATTFDLLADERHRKGHGVLALGDPDYKAMPDPDALKTRGGPRLGALPATRLEVQAVAGAADDVRLLGPQATERGLRDALRSAAPKRYWSSVHFACHGMVDLEQPALSCLALTPGDGEDGLLTANEVLRLDLRTDLAVLSACQTGRGRYVRGEGIMSLTRAFMHAGAPRVLVSLWDVDDDATAFLMKTFYREWNAGASASAALRTAQLAVRDHVVEVPAAQAGQPPTRRRPWADFRYWAAWVLWGLPD